MLEVFCNGPDAHVRLREGIDKVEFPTSTWRFASQRFGPRAQTSAAERPERDQLASAAPLSSPRLSA
jgi:hypothetical protein